MPKELTISERRYKLQDNLADSIAQICFLAQDFYWQDEEHINYTTMAATSHTIASLLAHNTVFGSDGVHSDVVIEELAEGIKDFNEWRCIARNVIKRLGGEK